jgi:hypothetical protein
MATEAKLMLVVEAAGTGESPLSGLLLGTAGKVVQSQGAFFLLNHITSSFLPSFKAGSWDAQISQALAFLQVRDLHQSPSIHFIVTDKLISGSSPSNTGCATLGLSEPLSLGIIILPISLGY